MRFASSTSAGGEVMPPVKVVVITVVMLAICQLVSMTGYGIW
ncbi:putative membrane protein [Escherichia coli 2-316-03_S4_C2]|nr:putative membrane protein [Escherichia coli 2-316-03_S4_C2]